MYFNISQYPLLRTKAKVDQLRIVSESVRRKWFDSGLLPSALRASFAVRAAPAAQWLLLPTNRRERFEPRMRPRIARVSPMDGTKVNKSDTREARKLCF